LHKSIHILLLEDNQADVFLFREALQTAPISAKLTAVLDAERGVELLHQDDFQPDLIVVDLNLAFMSGHDFLKECCSIVEGPPCIVFSSSLNEKDREMALEMGARDYVVKPVELRDYVSMVHGIIERWGPKP
jgi:DNA-binding response OmpR family regulator